MVKPWIRGRARLTEIEEGTSDDERRVPERKRPRRVDKFSETHVYGLELTAVIPGVNEGPHPVECNTHRSPRRRKVSFRREGMEWSPAKNLMSWSGVVGGGS